MQKGNYLYRLDVNFSTLFKKDSLVLQLPNNKIYPISNPTFLNETIPKLEEKPIIEISTCNHVFETILQQITADDESCSTFLICKICKLVKN